LPLSLGVMFEPDPNRTYFDAKREQVITLLNSTIRAHIALAGPSESTDAFVCTIKTGEYYETLIYFYLVQSNKGIVYHWDQGPQAREQAKTVEKEALRFLEAMGFQMDSLHFRKKTPEEQAELLKTFLPFQAQLPQKEEEVGAGLEAISIDESDEVLEDTEMQEGISIESIEEEPETPGKKENALGVTASFFEDVNVPVPEPAGEPISLAPEEDTFKEAAGEGEAVPEGSEVAVETKEEAIPFAEPAQKEALPEEKIVMETSGETVPEAEAVRDTALSVEDTMAEEEVSVEPDMAEEETTGAETEALAETVVSKVEPVVAEAEPITEVVAGMESEPIPEAAEAPVVVAEGEPVIEETETVVQTEAISEEAPVSESEQVFDVAPEGGAEPVAEMVGQAEPEPEAEPVAEMVAQAEPEPEAEPVAEMVAQAEPVTWPDAIGQESKPVPSPSPPQAPVDAGRKSVPTAKEAGPKIEDLDLDLLGRFLASM